LRKYLLENVGESFAEWCEPKLRQIIECENPRLRRELINIQLEYVAGMHKVLRERMQRYERDIQEFKRLLCRWKTEKEKLALLSKGHITREAQVQRTTAAYVMVRIAEGNLPLERQYQEIGEELSDLGNLTFFLQEYLGQQQGPNYYHPLDKDGNPKPVYGGPQNQPLKPSGDGDFILSQSECWCVYCQEKVEKAPEDKNRLCEMLVHKKCGRMLGSKVTMANDKRVYDYGQLKTHPHNKSEV
jgi:hypothetical protein